jgi:tubulin--tyrosine ligase like protein 10
VYCCLTVARTVLRASQGDVFVCLPGYVRLAMEPYSIDDPANKWVHLTNAAVQKTHPDYKGKASADETIWTLEELETTLVASEQAPEGFVSTSLVPCFKRVMRDVFEGGVALGLAQTSGCFDLFGFDFLVDESLRVWLLEVNTNPALHVDGTVHKAMFPTMYVRRMN